MHLGDAGPRRGGPAPAGEAGAGDRRLAVAGEALEWHPRTGRRRPAARSRRRAGTWRRRCFRPSRRRRRRTSRTGRPCTCPPAPRRRSPARAPPPARSPSRRSAPLHLASPTSALRSLACVRGSRARRQRLSPPHGYGAPRTRLCENGRDGTSDRGSDHREAARGHRPRAAPLDRRAGHGPLDRRPGERPGRRGRLADHRRLPDPLPLRTGGRQTGLRARRRDRGRRRLRRPLRRGERRPAGDARPRQAAAGRAGQGEERDLRRLRQGRRRQVDDDRQPGRGAERRRPPVGCPGLRRLRLLDPAHARRQRASPKSTASARSCRWRRRAASR